MEELPESLPVLSQIFAGLAVGGYFILQAVGKLRANGKVSKDTAAVIKAIDSAAEQYQHHLVDLMESIKRHEAEAAEWRREIRPVTNRLLEGITTLLARKG